MTDYTIYSKPMLEDVATALELTNYAFDKRLGKNRNKSKINSVKATKKVKVKRRMSKQSRKCNR